MQAEYPRELEAKFTLAKQEELDALTDAPDLPDGFAVGDSSVVPVADVYVDTLDMRLLRHGYTLRLRSKGNKQLVTLKSLEGLHAGQIQDRMEIEKPLTLGPQPFDPRRWPQDIRDIVFDIAGSELDLQPICNVRQTRYKEWIHTKATDSELSESPMAELSLDQVAVSAGDPGTIDWSEPLTEGAASHFLEVELELLDPTQEASFFTLVHWLEDRSELSPVYSSKLVSGLRAVAAQPLAGSTNREIDRLGIQPEMQMADACRLIWRQQMIEMCLNEAGVRADQDMEYVHAMRVATRRARAAYELFGENIKRKKAQNHVSFFKHTARKLGAVRDMDVALLKLAVYRKHLTKEERTDLKPAVKHWQQERRKRLVKLSQWLDSSAYARALIELDNFCRTPGLGTKRRAAITNESPPLTQVRHLLPSRILSRFEGVRRYEIVFAQTEQAPLETLHALRIDCKYLRYVLEFSKDLLGPEGATLIVQLKELQDVLGDLNDAGVVRAMLLDLPKTIITPGITAHIREQEAISTNLRALAPQSFATFVGFENRQLLMTALAYL